jgi:hypothetical protein
MMGDDKPTIEYRLREQILKQPSAKNRFAKLIVCSWPSILLRIEGGGGGGGGGGDVIKMPFRMSSHMHQLI